MYYSYSQESNKKRIRHKYWQRHFWHDEKDAFFVSRYCGIPYLDLHFCYLTSSFISSRVDKIVVDVIHCVALISETLHQRQRNNEYSTSTLIFQEERARFAYASVTDTFTCYSNKIFFYERCCIQKLYKVLNF